MKESNNIQKLLSDHRQLDEFKRFDLDKEWSSFSEFVKNESGEDLVVMARNHKIRKVLLYVILLVLVGLISFGIYYYNKPEPPKYQFAQTKDYKDTILLVDGSKVYLDRFSKLKYPIVLEEEIGRNLELDGNAEFDVAENEEYPFKVINKEIFVEVLGTIFNIEQKDNKATEITNKEGMVKVAEVENEDNFKVLNEGESFEYLDGNFTQTNLPEPEPPKPVINYTMTYSLYQIYEHLYTKSGGKILLADDEKIDGRAIVRMDLTRSNRAILRTLKRKGLIDYRMRDCRGCYDVLSPQ